MTNFPQALFADDARKKVERILSLIEAMDEVDNVANMMKLLVP